MKLQDLFKVTALVGALAAESGCDNNADKDAKLSIVNLRIGKEIGETRLKIGNIPTGEKEDMPSIIFQGDVTQNLLLPMTPKPAAKFIKPYDESARLKIVGASVFVPNISR